MDLVYTVQGDDQQEVAAALQELCAATGARSFGRILALPGRRRWMARAEARPEHGGAREGAPDRTLFQSGAPGPSQQPCSGTVDDDDATRPH